MELRNCDLCGKLFLYNGTSVICPNCFGDEDKQFEIVKNYLWENPNASLQQVCEDTGVKEQRVLKYLREGRIQLSDGSELKLHCELCGIEIEHGRICSACSRELEKSVQMTKGGVKKEEPSALVKAGKMFTEDLLNRKGFKK